ncbi:hypothetical protein M0R01_02835 [bacterium]|nr:hypothetical protein [bacterium]
MVAIKQNFTIICESAIIDQYTNNLYLLGIFSDINTQGVPAIHPSFSVVTNFSGGEGEHDLIITICHEDTEIAKLEGKINFRNGDTAQYIGKFINFSFPQYGKYNVYIYLDNIKQPLDAKINLKSI